MTTSIPPVTELEGLGTIAANLDVDRMTAEEIALTGLLGDVFDVDGRVAVRRGSSRTLGERELLEPRNKDCPSALVVKVKTAQEVKDKDRRWMGWHSALSPTEQADGVRGWWAVRDVEAWHGQLLVATVGGLVVGTWRITGHESIQGKLHRFVIEKPSGDDAGAAFYHDRRMKPVRGGVTLRLPLA